MLIDESDLPNPMKLPQRRGGGAWPIGPQSGPAYRFPVQWPPHMTTTTYTRARANFARLCNEAASSREPVIIRRRGAADVALVSADELQSLLETAHLLRSPKNARRLLTAMRRALRGKAAASSAADLRRTTGLDR